MGSLYPTLSQVIVSYLACLDIFSKMGVLHSIPLCSRGSGTNQVEPLDLDKNNNEASVVFTSQPQPIVVATEAPEATSTPRPQSPTGLANEQMASEAEDDSEAAAEEPPALSDSGLEESATEFEFSRPSPPTLTIDEDSLDGLEAIGLEDQNGSNDGGDEGVGESDETFDDTMVLDGHEEIDLNDMEEPQERPPEPTVPDERVDQSSSDEEESSQPQAHPQGQPQGQSQLKDETSRKISSLLSELVGDRPAGEAMHRPDLVPMR